MFKNKLFAVAVAAITFVSVSVSAAAYPWDYGTTEEPSYPSYTTEEDPDPYTTEEPPFTYEPPPDTSDTSEPDPPPVSSEPDPPVTSEPDPPPPPAPYIGLNFYETWLEVGNGAQLNAYIENNIWENPVIRFTSFNTDVAIVDDRGYIMAVGAGTAYITAYYGDLRADVTVYVSRPAEVPQFLVLKQNSFELKIGATAQIEAELLPESVADGYTITYESYDPEIAAVNDNGFITALKTGETTIAVRGADLTEYVTVTVSSDVAYATAKLDGYIYSGDGNPVVGAQLIIGALRAVSDTSGYFSFESVEQRELVISVAGDDKAVCGITPQGDTTMYLLYNKNKPLTRLGSYEELAGHLAINKVTFTTGANVIMTEGETFELVYEYAPKAAPVTGILYTAENTIIADVGKIDGIITAKAPGETDITVMLNGGQAKAVCHVVVNQKESTEHSVLIVIIETAVFAAAVFVFFMIYRSYKKKLTRTLDQYDDDYNDDYTDDE